MTTELRAQLQKLLGSTYILDHELGGGGMSRVFTATESALGRKVVVKVLPPEVGAGVKVERFKREIQFLARLNHPHIVPMLAAGGSGGLSYYVMPFMQGESLRARIVSRGGLPLGEVVRTLREVASALAFAHSNGIVHRDVKPDNVLLTGGSAMVTDFGVAKALSLSTGDGDPNALTSLGIALGTPAYIAPEQATADPGTDFRADIYSFGAMAYEMLSGKPPFMARSPQAMLAAHITEKPVPVVERRPGIPPLLNSLVMLCLEKSPENRPQSAEDLVRMLDEIVTPRETPTGASAGDGAEVTPGLGEREIAGASGGGNEARVPVASGTGQKPVAARNAPANRYLLIALALLVLALAVVGGRWLLSRGRVPSPGSVSRKPPASPAKSIAVLPLANVNGDPGNEYFSDQARSAYMVLLRADRRWDSVRADPRFVALLRKVGA